MCGILASAAIIGKVAIASFLQSVRMVLMIAWGLLLLKKIEVEEKI